MLVVFGVIGVVAVAGVALLVINLTHGPGGIIMPCLGTGDTVPVHVIEKEVSGKLILKGCIERGVPIYDTVDTYDDDGWVFHGEAGEMVTTALNATSDELDPELLLYDSWGHRIAENDDVIFMMDANSWLPVSLPSTGAYTIVVSAFALAARMS